MLNNIFSSLDRHLKRHPCPCAICLPTAKYSKHEKLAGIKTVNNIFHNKLDAIYRPLLINLQSRFKNNRRCFIIGNGPSLNKTDLSKLKNEISFGVNGIFLKTSPFFHPTFYVVEDHLVAEDRAQQINQLKGVIKLFPVYLSYCLREAPDTVFFNHLPRKSYPLGFDFSTNAVEVTYTGGTVTFTCMQLAYFLGFKEIILIGVDHSYTIPDSTRRQSDYNIEILDMDEDDPNHFSSSYFGKGFRWHNPHVEVMEKAYLEAKKVTEENGVTILNATKGGNLEIFERRDYDDLFHTKSKPLFNLSRKQTLINIPVCNTRKKRKTYLTVKSQKNCLRNNAITYNTLEKLPKVLVVSSTLLGKDSATGALMNKLFTYWPKSFLAQLHTDLGTPDKKICDTNIYFSPRDKHISRTQQAIAKFEPDLIYFRLTEDVQLLYFIQHYIILHKIPFVTHIMDDWHQKLLGTNPSLYHQATPILCWLFNKAKCNFSISKKMAIAFEQRFNAEFEPCSNFIEPCEIKKPLENNEKKTRGKADFIIRYCGSITANMQLQSLLDVASAVTKLQNEIPVKLEIFTHPRFKKNIRSFKKFNNISLSFYSPDDNYIRRLQEADLLLVTANFDNNSLNYIRYSMANKVPEIMASGTPILAYGPLEAGTIEYLHNGKWAYTVTEQDQEALTNTIRTIYHNNHENTQLSRIAKKQLVSHHNALTVRNTFQNRLISAVDSKKLPRTKLVLVGEYTRQEQVSINETAAIAHVYSSNNSDKILVNVGAHHGAELPAFLDNGWKVYAFEPDELNRATLKKRLGSYSQLKIDSRAVSDQVTSNCSFYSSSESTGISSLAPFHSSHTESGLVSVTTLAEACNNYTINTIDFLLIDAEGYDLFVLKGLDWNAIKPDIIVCEFEDRKTKQLGYDFQELALFLQNHGYKILVSEWHPITRYGIRHDWRRLVVYPCELADTQAWGNLIAFRDESVLPELISSIGSQATSRRDNGRYARNAVRRLRYFYRQLTSKKT